MKRSVPFLQDVANAPAAVLGFGRAGQHVCDYLLSIGSPPTVYAEGEVPHSLLRAYAQRGVRFVRGFPETLPERVIFRSPGIRPDLPVLSRAVASGSVLTGECDLFLQRCRASVIGVTGSDGKTTTANLIAAILRAAGHRVLLGGNNGTELLSHLSELTPRDFAVVELSSFQLMTAPAPDIAVITNITPNHLNWHTDMREYVAAKCRIFDGAQRLVTSAACPLTREIAARAALPVTLFCGGSALPASLRAGDSCVTVEGDEMVYTCADSQQRVRVLDVFALPGAHNRENLAAALGAVAQLVSPQAIRAAAGNFRGVPHRLQTVNTVGGVRYINSSIDTSPTRVAAALSALDCRPIVIVGGRTKGISLAPLADTLAQKASAAVAYGEAAAEIATCLADRIPFAMLENFDDAFRAAVSQARAGDTVLLSPGCTAYGEFRDFEERGDRFCRLVEALAGERT